MCRNPIGCDCRTPSGNNWRNCLESLLEIKEILLARNFQILQLLTALPSNNRKMRCTKRAGATSPCWLLSADWELEAWIGFATFRRNWHGLCRHEYHANCRQREALQKVTQLFEDGSRRASLKFWLKSSYDSTNMSHMFTAYKSLELQNLDKVG